MIGVASTATPIMTSMLGTSGAVLSLQSSRLAS
jgi:hypothetical protein